MKNKSELLLEKIRAEEVVNQADFFDLENLTFTDDVRSMCEQNTCGRYNRAWNCPPVCGTVAELEAVCRGFSGGILINSVTHVADSFDWEGMMEGGRGLCSLLIGVKGFTDGFDLEDYRIFGGGGCYGCEDCSYPDNPCHHPDMLFTPIEACGINVMQLAKDAGFKYINGQNTVTFFGMVLYND
jgi:predicted metal-binding protein